MFVNLLNAAAKSRTQDLKHMQYVECQIYIPPSDLMLRSKALYPTCDDQSKLVKADFVHLSQLDISDVTLVA